MIEGLHLDIPGVSLRKHIAARRDHHLNRRAFYETQIASLQVVANDCDNEFAPSSSNSPQETFKSKINTHRENSQYFDLLHEFTSDAETYRLDHEDLRRLEYITTSYR